MALKTKVKISAVNNLSDARYAAGMGVEMIGFTMDENHPKFIALSTIKEITTWVSGVKVVGEFQATNVENINFLAESLNLDIIQIPHPIPIEELPKLQKPIILEVTFNGSSITVENTLAEYAPFVSYFLLKFEESPDMEKILPILKSWAKKFPIILSDIIKITNFEMLLNEVQPWGIDLPGGEEIRPGYNNFEELADILEALEEE